MAQFLLDRVRTAGGSGFFTPDPNVVMLTVEPLGALIRNLHINKYINK
jgi:hypothetical protein